MPRRFRAIRQARWICHPGAASRPDARMQRTSAVALPPSSPSTRGLRVACHLVDPAAGHPECARNDRPGLERTGTSRFGFSPRRVRWRPSTRSTYNLTRVRSLGLIGESGSGKSVTLRALLRLLPAHRFQHFRHDRVGRQGRAEVVKCRTAAVSRRRGLDDFPGTGDSVRSGLLPWVIRFRKPSETIWAPANPRRGPGR